MYTLIVENDKGEQLKLTQNEAYDVLKIEGLNPSSATINIDTIAGFDGAIYNSSRVGPRNIVIYLNIKFPIEENRQQLYNYFRTSQKVRLYFKNQNRNVYIDGYVETFENDLFGMTQQPQISIICPDPFFKELNDFNIEFSNTISLFEFPFSIESEGIEFSEIKNSVIKNVDAGDIETGVIITFTAIDDQILNPIIYNRTAQTFFGLDIDLQKDDVIIVNTNTGKKSATLIRDNTQTNIISKLKEKSSWLKLLPGPNEISFDADEGIENLSLKISFARKYGGV